MPQVEILVCETFTIDRNAARPVPLENVAALDHELLDDAVEGRLEIPSGLRTSQKFARAHPPEVFCGFRSFVTKQLHLYSARRYSTYSNVEEDDGVASGNSVQDDGVRHRDGHGGDVWRGGQAAIYDALPAPSFTALRRCDGVRRSISRRAAPQEALVQTRRRATCRFKLRRDGCKGEGGNNYGLNTSAALAASAYSVAQGSRS